MSLDSVSTLVEITQTDIYQSIQGRIPSEQEINVTVEHYRKLLGFANDDAIKAISILQSRLTVSMDTGEVIRQASTYKPWLSGRKADIDFFYWNRYARYLEIDQKWSRNVVSAIDSVSDRMLDLLGDPIADGGWQRRGLVLGDVQSGKTANYTALINKAADAGYRVIILLTGMIENLRRQTQERLDEGFIGRSSKAALQQNQQTIRKGVGNIDARKFAMAFTTESNDFKINTVRSINMSLTNANQPVLFVIKKNVAPLGHLISWLKTYNMDNGTGSIDLPLLLIDDEADNASINTRALSDPTAINKNIRLLLNLFHRASYVGVTATPFANIFIEPDTTDEMLKDDLFPRDFIYALSPPSNYIGSTAIFSEEGNYSNLLELNDDASECFPFGHKIDIVVNYLPVTLVKSMYYFILVNAIRDLRGDKTTHRSMLINVSRFTGVQNKVAELVVEWFHTVNRDIQNYYKLKENVACKNENIRNLKEIWKEFKLGEDEFSWAMVQGALHGAAAPIEVRAVNQKSSSSNLDYESRKDSGWRLVAIGGNSLSRGLTLEGLCVSYFYRNTQMYDTLMQMGRWFGYRIGYEDLCKIWMPTGAIDWYSKITEATNELREEIRLMNRAGLSPADFGLRVRAHPESLLVTARNKMKSAKTIEMWITLDGEFFETPRLISETKVLHANLNAAGHFLNYLMGIKKPNIEKKHKVWQNIPRNGIIEFIKEYTNHPQNMESDPSALTEYIASSTNFAEWDVVLAGGDGIEIDVIKDFSHNAIGRKIEKGLGSTLCVSGTKLRVGTGRMTRFGLTEEQKIKAQEEFVLNHAEGKKLSDKAYLIEGRRPIIILYYLQANNPMPSGILESDLMVAYGIGFPRVSKGVESKKQKYVLNVTAQRNIFTPEEDEEDDDIDYDDI